MIRYALGGLASNLASIICLLLIASWLQRVHPAFDSISHFRMHLVVLLVPFIFTFLIARKKKRLVLSIATLVITMGLSAPYLPGMGPILLYTPAPSQKRFSIVQFNMRFNNSDIAAITSVFRSANPDVFILQELTNVNIAAMNALKETHPHQFSCISTVVGSVAIASRHPFLNNDVQVCSRRKGYLAAQIDFAGQTITLANLHTRWPWPFQQARQLKDLEDQFGKLNPPLIVAGDFNSAPWSHAAQKVARLTQTNVVTGLLFTWKPVSFGLDTNFPSLLSLDQTLHSREFVPIKRRKLREGSSDHSPILTEFLLSTRG